MVGPSFSGSGPALERLAFAIGIKPALRIQVTPSQADAAAARWRAKGLAAHPRGGLLYVSRDEERVRALIEAEARVLPGGRAAPESEVLAAHRELGRLLGYPACCVEAFLERVRRGVTVRREGGEASERFVAIEDALARSARCDFRLNVLLPRREALVPFDPCRFDCDVALVYAVATLDAYRERRADDAAALAERLVGEFEIDGLVVRFAR